MSSPHIVQISRSNFDAEVKQSPVPVLVDFWAEWCGPCKALAPLLDAVADANVGKVKVVKVNVDDNQELAAEYGVRAIPTLFIFKNGAAQEQIVGIINRKDLDAKLAAHMG